MSRYTYQHLETIRERAVKRGLKAEIARRTSDDEPYLVIELGPDRAFQLAYHTDFGRLSSFSIWGPTASRAIELDVLHQILTDGLVAPRRGPPPRCERGGSEDCGGCRFDAEGVCEAQF